MGWCSEKHAQAQPVQRGEGLMDWKLEVVVVPVADIDRAKSFYSDKVGFHVDHDTAVSDKVRVVQLTPPGSACSIVLGKGIVEMAPGTLKGLQLVVQDIHAARAHLVERGVDASEVQVYDSGSFRPSREGDALENVAFVYFNDPDGNSWAVQQISERT
jgi:catechol 2,3-dioxygenase-like lactoylglutathione lyase family enzyme